MAGDRVHTLDEAIRFFERLEGRVREGTETALAEFAKSVAYKAKAAIGAYQRVEVGPATPWAELADRTKQDRRRLGFPPNQPGLRRGDMRQSYSWRKVAEFHYQVGSPEKKALWFELGTRRGGAQYQPPRAITLIVTWRERDKLPGMVLRAIGRRVEKAM